MVSSLFYHVITRVTTRVVAIPLGVRVAIPAGRQIINLFHRHLERVVPGVYFEQISEALSVWLELGQGWESH